MQKLLYTVSMVTIFNIQAMELQKDSVQPDAVRLCRAIYSGKKEEYEALLKSEIPVNCKVPDDLREEKIDAFIAGKTPLQIAVRRRRYDVVCLLLAKGAHAMTAYVPHNHDTEWDCYPIGSEIPTGGDTALHMVTRSMLFECDLALRPRDGSFDATQYLQCVSALLAHGAQITARNNLDETLFHVFWKDRPRDNVRIGIDRTNLYTQLLETILLSQAGKSKDRKEQRAAYLAMVQVIKSCLEKSERGRAVSDPVCSQYELMKIDKSGWDIFCNHTDCAARQTLGLCGGLEKIANKLPLPSFNEEKE